MPLCSDTPQRHTPRTLPPPLRTHRAREQTPRSGRRRNERPYGEPPPGGERTRGRAGQPTSTLGLGGLPDCDATAANGCPRDRDTKQAARSLCATLSGQELNARSSGSEMTDVGIDDSDPRRLTARPVSTRQHPLGRSPTGDCSVGSCPSGDARRALQSARHRLPSEPGS